MVKYLSCINKLEIVIKQIKAFCLCFLDFLNINAPILVFDKFMEEIDRSKYLKNRTIRVNEEFTAMQKEVIYNIESTQGTLLKINLKELLVL